MDSDPQIRIEQAREHNLRSLDIGLDRGAWTAIVGPSGSGKSTLVFDVLVAEGERRFLGSQSSKALQFFGKLGRAKVGRIAGLPVPIAVGRRSITSNPRSTVGTQSGVLDLLRLLFAREAQHPSEERLTRSHFSFNAALGQCEVCLGLGLEDHVDPELLIADDSKSIRGGALVPTLPSGYTVYSQVTLDVMDSIARAHGFDVETPWNELTGEQREVVLFGTKKLKVPFGKHSLESRMKWEGITARPREEGFYRGIVPVIEETLLRNRNSNILRFVRSIPCSACQGSRLNLLGREARLPNDVSLPDLVDLCSSALLGRLRELEATPVGASIAPSLRSILQRLVRLGLGHLTFDRSSASLSGGEAQRLRLGAHLVSGLSNALYALDEPTLGLHPAERAGMREVLDELVEQGNTLVVVEHDPDMVEFADRVLELGPGAGPRGGELVREWASGAGALSVPDRTRRAQRSSPNTIRLTGATLHNLQATELTLHEGAFHAVIGASGSGKSSLVFGTLLPALLGERGGPYERLIASDEARVSAVDARPMGRSSRSTPATWSGVFDTIRKRFAATGAAKQNGLSASAFSFNSTQGRCATCEGLGVVRVGLHLLDDAVHTCPACRGRRYRPEVLEVTLKGRTIADVLELPIELAAEAFASDPAIEPTLRAMTELGIGYLRLGTSSTTLSSGESQRIRLATLLGKPARTKTLFAFDEPDRGLHPSDLTRLLDAYDKLLAAGHTIVAISHHRQLWAAADHLIELKAGVAAPCRLEDALEAARTATPPRHPRSSPPRAIELRGVTTHNLRTIDVEIPHGKVTAILGPSGSGKSSLAFDTLAAEAWHRYAESLPFQVRRFVRRLPRPSFRTANGLTPTLAIRQTAPEPNDRSTVGTLAGLSPLLRLLWSRCSDSEQARTAAHFRPEGGLAPCPSCQGKGTLERCTEAGLQIDGTRSIAGGAFHATKPGTFFTEPGGQHVATMRAATGHDLSGPWNDLPQSVRSLVLHGLPGRVLDVRWEYERGARKGTHSFRGTWDGLHHLTEVEAAKRSGQKRAEEWREPLSAEACRRCGQTGLAEEVAGASVEGLAYRDAVQFSFDELHDSLEARRDASPALATLWPELRERFESFVEMGLGALVISRPARSLTRSELQRLRLASILRADLSGTTLVLDEPSAGLSEAAAAQLAGRLRRLAAEGNTVVVVTHRRVIFEAADHVLTLGPGAGPNGGQVTTSGPRSELDLKRLHSECFKPNALASIPSVDPDFFDQPEWALAVPRQGLICARLDDPRPLFESIERASPCPFQRVVRGSGLVTATTVLHALKGMPAFQELFAQAAAACGQDLPKAAFSYLSPKGRCPTCRGSGQELVAMDFMSDLAIPCPVCAGARFRPEVLAVRREDLTPAEFLDTPAESIASLPEGRLQAAVHALQSVGLGHLSLGRSTRSLSGGERQRLALAALLANPKAGTLLLLDDPARGLSERDLSWLVQALRRFTEAGCAVLCVTDREALHQVSKGQL